MCLSIRRFGRSWGRPTEAVAGTGMKCPDHPTHPTTRRRCAPAETLMAHGLACRVVGFVGFVGYLGKFFLGLGRILRRAFSRPLEWPRHAPVFPYPDHNNPLAAADPPMALHATLHFGWLKTGEAIGQEIPVSLVLLVGSFKRIAAVSRFAEDLENSG
jgi:hypothetical protein